MSSHALIGLVVVALIAIGLIGRFGERERPQTPRFRPAPERAAPEREAQPRRPLPEARLPEQRPPESRPPETRPPETRPPDNRVDGNRRLAPPSAGDPTIDVPVGSDKRSSSGTAFSLDPRGVWVTARHVADGCDRIFVLSGPREGYRVRSVYVHASADIAILRTDRGAPHLALTSEAPRIEQLGYHFGYPKGEPGAVQSTLIGRATMRARGRYNTSEPVLVWADRVRVPESEDHLGGISGGPSFDATGRVNGVTVAGSTRRGRIFTADMSSLRAALARANVTPTGESGAERPRLSASGWVQDGAELRRKLAVAKVVCVVEERNNFRGRSF
jgi:hypothetical protein